LNGVEPAKKIVPTARNQAEVWGSPIDHSLSPALHQAAYKALGLPWTYLKREVTEATLQASLEGCGPDIVGLSLTMPLKEEIVKLVTKRSPIVELLGAANTVVRVGDGWMLDNTDPWGVSSALSSLSTSLATAWIVGAGATARSVGYALARMGTRSVTLIVRSLERAEQTRAVLIESGLEVTVRHVDSVVAQAAPDLVVNTVPGSNPFPMVGNIRWLTHESSLFDVVYAPWPSPAALAWEGSPRPIISGLHMLIFQAVRQVRLFVNGDGDHSLPDEEHVLAAMRKAIAGDSANSAPQA